MGIVIARSNLEGASWMTLAMLGYVVNDAFIKKAVEDLELFQAVCIRGVLIVAILSLVARARGELVDLRRHAHPMVGLRVAMEAASTVLYLLALSRLPLASVTAVLQLVPVAVTFVAARVLREAVSWHRVGAVVAGFAGVLLVVRPGTDAASPWFLAALAAMTTVVAREVVTTRVPGSIPSLVLALATATVIATMGGVVSVVEGWAPIDVEHVVLLAVAAAFLSVAYTASVVAVRVGEISFTAPFRYSILVFAIVLQIVVFGDVPDALTFVGSAVVAAAGVYALVHEPRVVAPVARG